MYTAGHGSSIVIASAPVIHTPTACFSRPRPDIYMVEEMLFLYHGKHILGANFRVTPLGPNWLARSFEKANVLVALGAVFVGSVIVP